MYPLFLPPCASKGVYCCREDPLYFPGIETHGSARSAEPKISQVHRTYTYTVDDHFHVQLGVSALTEHDDRKQLTLPIVALLEASLNVGHPK